jgi:ATP-dependent protease ClpP protease subunit
MKNWYHIKALAVGDATEVMIYGDIGSNWDGTGIAAAKFVEEFNAITTAKINLHINSYGGDVFEGLAICTAIKSHPADVHTFVDGVAASIASAIAIAGDDCTIAPNAYFMIHEAWTFAMGTKNDLRQQADLLDKLDAGLAKTYAEKTGKTAEEMSAAMVAETWYNAEEAKTIGLCDAIGGEDAAMTEPSAKAILKSKTAPKALRRIAASVVRKPDPVDDSKERAEVEKALAQLEADLKSAA